MHYVYVRIKQYSLLCMNKCANKYNMYYQVVIGCSLIFSLFFIVFSGFTLTLTNLWCQVPPVSLESI